MLTKFLDQVLPPCEDMPAAVKEMLAKAAEEAKKMAEEDPLAQLSDSDKQYLMEYPDAKVTQICGPFGTIKTVVLRKRLV